MNKSIFCVVFSDDIGELWLNEDLLPISFVHSSHANFDDEYRFIFESLDVSFIKVHLEITDEEFESFETPDRQALVEFYNKYKKRIIPLITNELISSTKSTIKGIKNFDSSKPLVFVLDGETTRARELMQKDITECGYLVLETINEHVSYLVQANPDSQSSKIKTAKGYGIPVISEKELYEILNRKYI